MLTPRGIWGWRCEMRHIARRLFLLWFFISELTVWIVYFIVPLRAISWLWSFCNIAGRWPVRSRNRRSILLVWMLRWSVLLYTLISRRLPFVVSPICIFSIIWSDRSWNICWGSIDWSILTLVSMTKSLAVQLCVSVIITFFSLLPHFPLDVFFHLGSFFFPLFLVFISPLFWRFGFGRRFGAGWLRSTRWWSLPHRRILLRLRMLLRLLLLRVDFAFNI